jgi:hypothetical protein
MVAQVSNLLYRRFPIGRRRLLLYCQMLRNPAKWNSAIQQVGNLRYFYRLSLERKTFCEGMS